MRPFKRMLPLAAAFLFMTLTSSAAFAQIGIIGQDLVGGRKEKHESDPRARVISRSFRNTRTRSAFWLYSLKMDEFLQNPNVGCIEFAFRLVDEEGRPAVEARWTKDDLLPYEKWTPLVFISGKWRTTYNVDGHEADIVGMFFGGKTKHGSRSYTKLRILGWEPTIYTRRKDLKRVADFEFAIYDLQLGKIAPTNRLLANAQEAKGAGGTSALGPEVDQEDETEDEVDDVKDDRRPRNPRNGDDRDRDDAREREPRGKSTRRTIPVIFEGQSYWTRAEWDNGKVTEQKIDGHHDLPIPGGATSLTLYILEHKGDKDGWKVTYNGRDTRIPVTVKDIRVRQTN